MKNIFLKIILLISFFTVQSYAQTLNLFRTDVDSARSNFITATYQFGIDIIADSINNCSRVMFDLSFDKANFIKYSGYNPTTRSDSVYYIINPEFDTIAAKENIFVGVYYDALIPNIVFNNPKIIHLDFVVLQNTPNGTNVTFQISNAKAVIKINGKDSTLELKVNPTNYISHGYVNVWPGDADNKGSVDNKDFTMIGLLLGHGSGSKFSKSFKREPASTIWQPQSALLWDCDTCTFADCDGNGEITILDMLVVLANFKKTISATEKYKEEPLSLELGNTFLRSPHLIKIPIYTDCPFPYIGAAGRISWQNLPERIEVLGVEKGELFDTEQTIIYSDFHPDQKYIDVVVGTVDKSKPINKSGIIAYLVVDGNNDLWQNFNPEVRELTGVTVSGYFFPLNVVSKVDEETKYKEEITISHSENFLFVQNNSQVQSILNINIYDVFGNLHISRSFPAEINICKYCLDISNMLNGAYFAIISSNNNIAKSYPFLIVK